MTKGDDTDFMNFLFENKNKRTRKLMMATSLMMVIALACTITFIWLWSLFGLREPIAIFMFGIALAAFGTSSGVMMGYQYRWREEQDLPDSESREWPQ